MIIYLILLSIGLALFWLYYQVFLKNSTHFKMIRSYFLVAVIGSLLIPLAGQIQLDALSLAPFENHLSDNYLNTSILSPVAEFKQDVSSINFSKSNSFNWLKLIYVSGCIILLVRIIFSTIAILRLKSNSEHKYDNGTNLYFNSKITQPFSLFSSIYLPYNWLKNTPEEVLEHELVHIKQRHFIDLLFTEIITIVLWFNPIAYLLKRAVRTNLEYLADQEVLNKGRDISNYQALLLTVATEGIHRTPLNIYFNVPLKNRITMMTKGKNNARNKLTILGVLPIIGLLFAFNVSKDVKAPLESLAAPLITLVEDENPPCKLPLDRSKPIKITSAFGMTLHPVLKVEKMHNGVDLRAAMGTPVYASGAGVIEMAAFDEQHGYYVQIKHSEKYQSRYSHLKDFIVLPNIYVTEGQLIGYSGSSGKSTGPHLHFEVMEDGEHIDPKSVVKELEGC